MVTVAEGDHVLVARVLAGGKDGDFVRFAPAVREVGTRKARRHFFGELFGELHDGRVEVDRRRVLQTAGLLANALHDLRVAVADADRDDAGEAIQVLLARLVPHVLHVAFDDHQRIAVIRDDAGRQILMAEGQDLFLRRSIVRGRRVIADRQGMLQINGHGRAPGRVRVKYQANRDFTVAPQNCYAARQAASTAEIMKRIH